MDTPAKAARDEDESLPALELSDGISELRRQMMEAAEKLEYERAAELRDRIKRLERRIFGFDSSEPAAPAAPPGSPGSRAQREKGRADETPPHGQAPLPSGPTLVVSGQRRAQRANGA